MILKLLQRIGNFFARMSGVPILVAIGLVIVNFVLQLLPDWPIVGWMAQTDLLLHVGLVFGLLGLLLGEVL
jgi:hypothetical protein